MQAYKNNNNKSSLVIVGTGIKSLSHLTVEARANIEQADIVLYLINEPAMKAWITHANPNTKSLDDIYFKSKLRIEAYKEITEYILSEIDKNKHVCVVLYGHPAVYAKPALDAVIMARKKGIPAIVLPAVSAEDCLFADLKIDPSTSGCLSYEATDLLIYRRHIDPACHVLIWQISAIGAQGHVDKHDNTEGIAALTRYLLSYYNPEHQAVVYVAAQYPGFMPVIDHITIAELSKHDIPVIATLYIPPAIEIEPDWAMLASIGFKIK